MKDIHGVFTRFKENHPQVYARYEELGKEVHLNGGPLDEPTRWLIKIGISAAAGRKKALKTHIIKARAAGVSDEALAHALMLLIPTQGLAGFMESYTVLDAVLQGEG